MFLNWMVTTMCYYGLTSAASTLTPDLYLNYSLAILVEIPAHFAALLLLDRLGRKPVLGYSQLLAGVTCIAAGFVTSPGLRWLQVRASRILYILKFCLSMNRFLCVKAPVENERALI